MQAKPLLLILILASTVASGALVAPKVIEHKPSTLPGSPQRAAITATVTKTVTVTEPCDCNQAIAKCLVEKQQLEQKLKQLNQTLQELVRETVEYLRAYANELNKNITKAQQELDKLLSLLESKNKEIVNEAEKTRAAINQAMKQIQARQEELRQKTEQLINQLSTINETIHESLQEIQNYIDRLPANYSIPNTTAIQEQLEKLAQLINATMTSQNND